MAYIAPKDYAQDPELLLKVMKVMGGDLDLSWMKDHPHPFEAKPSEPDRGLTLDDINRDPAYGPESIPEIVSRFEVVEEDCIGCGLCPERAPENFEIPAGTSIAQVLKQPETPAEEEACREAFDYCPIGGLQMITPDSSPADCTAGGPHPTSIPAGCPTPGHFTATRQES